MQYSLFFYILFMAFCGVFAKINIGLPNPAECLVPNFSQKVIENGKEVIKTIVEEGCPLPGLDCPNENVTFWYYSRLVGDHPIPIGYTSSRSVNVDKLPGAWKLLIHGFAQSRHEFPIKDLTEAYYEKGDYNILVVDYKELVNKKCFRSSVRNIPVVAKCTAEMLEFLIDKKVFTPDIMHVIGFGLGAHVAGSLYHHLRSGRLGRVTALDPFSLNIIKLPSIELSPNSGDYVDIFHTNAIFKHIALKAGHAEFFFNTGVFQPGCYEDEKDLLSCSHKRAVSYYVESITHANDPEHGLFGIPCPSFQDFIAKRCAASEENLMKIGEGGDLRAREIYYLQTDRKHPFYLDKKYEYDPNYPY